MKILVATGSSGGHIFPALSFLSALKNKYPGLEALLVLPKESIKVDAEKSGCRVSYISISRFRLRPCTKAVIAAFNLIKGSAESLFILAGFRPQVVVGFGSLDCVPVVFFAWLFRIKTLVHEQNLIPGKANRLLSRIADKVCVSFPETQEYLKCSRKKTVVTGNPIRSELVLIAKDKALGYFGFSRGKLTLLAMGGSQGSHHINLALLTALRNEALRKKLQVVHITGSADYQSVKDGYAALGVEARVFDFFKEMQYAYSAADLAVSRSGALSLTEIIHYSVPAILVPYPYAYSHQSANAGYLQKKGCAFVVKDEELDGPALEQRLESLILDPGEMGRLRSGLKNVGLANAAELLAEQAVLAAES